MALFLGSSLAEMCSDEVYLIFTKQCCLLFSSTCCCIPDAVTDCSWLHAVVMCAVAYAQNPFDKVVGAVNDAAQQVTGVGDKIQGVVNDVVNGE